MDDFSPIDEEPEKWLTAFQSLGVILAFFVLLVWSSNWKNDKPPVVIPASVFIGDPPPPLPEAKPKKEKKTINEEIKTFNDAEIALKKKQEKKLADKKKRDEEALEKKRKEKELADEKRKEKERKEEEKKKLADKKKRDEEALEKERKLAADEAERQRLSDETAAKAARASHLSRMQDIYIGRIVGRIQSHLITPKSVPNDESIVVVFRLRLSPDGELEDLPEIVESSGYEEYDESVRRALLKAGRLPMPKEPELLEDFQDMILHISPKDL